jgi:hypothetical protein
MNEGDNNCSICGSETTAEVINKETKNGVKWRQVCYTCKKRKCRATRTEWIDW